MGNQAMIYHDGVPSVIAAGYKFVVEPDAISSVVAGTGNVALWNQTWRPYSVGRWRQRTVLG